ncbi:MAG: hypothetical protein IJ728_04640, partial [Selenomonadaceae bacterium]|nr:hypothetical protein [Selenomonadaceae bacterium]
NDLKRQAGIIKELVNALGYDIAYAQDGSEGDDAIGTLTNNSTEKILIVSVDADMLQLLSKTVKVELLSKGKREIYDEMRFEQEYDILATQFADYKALRGDTSDNIPGVKGIGAITARRLINTHKTLDNIYQNIGLIKPARIREILKAGKEIAYLSLELAKIEKNIQLEWSNANFDDGKVKEICDREGLLSLKVRLYGKENLLKLPDYEIAGKYVYKLKTAIKAEEKIEGKKYDLELMAYVLDPERGVKKLEGRLTVKGRLIENIGRQLESELKASGLMNLYDDIELPLVKILADMEIRGMKVNLQRLKSENVLMTKELIKIEQEIYEEAGKVFNLNSAQQLGKILFDSMGIAPIKRNKNGYSTDAEVLKQLENDYPFVAKVIRYRQLFKLKRTYLDGLERQLDSDGKIHTTFNQTLTSTGRLSSSDPNMQNIPIRTDEGRVIRSIFEPSEGFDYILSADYSQIELRILAHLSGDELLIKAFVNDEDIHASTAEEVFGDRSLRGRAKAVNYGIVYGISDFGLAKQLHISRREAAEYIKMYLTRYSGIHNYMNRLIEEGRRLGYVETMYGRRRQLPGLESKSLNMKHTAERQAMNTPIQGSAADIIKIAMIGVERELQRGNYKSRMILQVHDELVLEVVEAELEEVKKIVKDQMENAAKMKVPLKVDINVGTNWALAK